MPTLEYAPDDFRPLPVDLRNVYTSYLNGIIMSDIADINWAGRQLADQEGYLMRSAGGDAKLLSTAIMDGDPDEIQRVHSYALPNLIRSYQYSGIGIDAGLIELTARRCGYDKRWLREIDLPSSVVLKGVMGVESKHERRILRQRGLQAMQQLGLVNKITGPVAWLETLL